MALTVEADLARPPADPTPRRGRARTILRLVVIALAGLSFVPSVLPFTVGTGGDDRVCVAIKDGWHRDRSRPSDADLEELFASFSVLPTPEEMRDPEKRALWFAEEEARTSTPGYRRAEAYVNWVAGDGACVPEARHRLIQTGLGLGGVAVLAGAGIIVTRKRTARHSS